MHQFLYYLINCLAFWKQILAANNYLYLQNVQYNIVSVHNYIDESSDGASKNIVTGPMSSSVLTYARYQFKLIVRGMTVANIGQ
jgi:hypothetical protein